MLSIRCLKLAGLYLVAGMSMGVFMGATKNFALAPVHAHVNLLGWVTLAIAAAVFRLWPQAERTKLAQTFFWLYNLCLPVTLGALMLLLTGHPGVEPVLAITEIGVWLGGVLFVLNLFLAIKAEPRARPMGAPASADGFVRVN